VRLVGKAGVGRDLGGRAACGQQPPRRLHPELALVVTRRAFLASGIAASTGDIIGKPYEDGSGHTYLELFGQPVVVYAADPGLLSQAHQRALAREMPMAIYTMDMFTTGNDDDNRAVVRAVPAAELNVAGLAVHGPRNAVDKIFKGATLHP